MSQSSELQTDLEYYLKKWDEIDSKLTLDPQNAELLASRTRIEQFIGWTRYLMREQVNPPAALEATSGLTSVISGPASEKVENSAEIVSVSEDKKRKLDEETPDIPLDKKRKTEATELVPSGSGVFVVTDTDTFGEASSSDHQGSVSKAVSKSSDSSDSDDDFFLYFVDRLYTNPKNIYLGGILFKLAILERKTARPWTAGQVDIMNKLDDCQKYLRNTEKFLLNEDTMTSIESQLFTPEIKDLVKCLKNPW